jgi:L-2-hydroxyglutarate oxidase LhgO
MSLNCDVLIAGGGVVGLAVGKELLASNPKLKVLVIEKEKTLGFHASGRNSGVLHAGFYYSPDSLKAKFCREGNLELRQLCRRYGIRVLDTGKIVVAKNKFEVKELEKLYLRGLQNEVRLELLEEKQLKDFEPHAHTHERFLWSPTTGVSDPHAIIGALSREFVDLGGTLFPSSLLEVKDDGRITINGEAIEYRHFVNCAGTQSDRIAQKFNVGNQFTIMPFMGVYKSVSHTLLPLKTLIYPVPHPINPFLGVHFTLTLDGQTKIGPTAIPVLGRENYSVTQGISLRDSLETLKGFKSMVFGKTHDVSNLLSTELPKLSGKVLVREASLLVPSARKIKDWKSRPPGIRAQLIDTKSGQLQQDFVVLPGAKSTHVLNAVSPGWTSAIPFGRWIVKEKILPQL